MAIDDLGEDYVVERGTLVEIYQTFAQRNIELLTAGDVVRKNLERISEGRNILTNPVATRTNLTFRWHDRENLSLFVDNEIKDLSKVDPNKNIIIDHPPTGHLLYEREFTGEEANYLFVGRDDIIKNTDDIRNKEILQHILDLDIGSLNLYIEKLFEKQPREILHLGVFYNPKDHKDMGETIGHYFTRPFVIGLDGTLWNGRQTTYGIPLIGIGKKQ